MKHLLAGIFVICMSMSITVFSMSSNSLLNNLAPFWDSLESLRKEIQESKDMALTSRLEQSYDLITLQLLDSQNQYFVYIQFEVRDTKKLSKHSVLCRDKKLLKKINSLANKLLIPFQWSENPSSSFELSDNQKRYLEIADRIGFLGNDIHARPSYYNIVSITSDYIKLEQDNHWNSRCLEDDYYFRNLHFSIPLTISSQKKESETLVGVGYIQIGDMEIFFQDNSSKNNRSIGERILNKIEQEKSAYK